ncbi:hypothetical protein KUCAC02_037580, partial [Chaenocephalus aceratus]
CPSETYDALHKSTRDFPDEVLMWDPVLPLGRRPVLTRVNSTSILKRVVVDRVEAEDGAYEVLHLGTGFSIKKRNERRMFCTRHPNVLFNDQTMGEVVKAVSVAKDNLETEEIILEELTVFQSPTPILSMELSTREQLYVCSSRGVVQLELQRCDLYGGGLRWLLPGQRPYCSWDGTTCSRYFPSSKNLGLRGAAGGGSGWRGTPPSWTVFLVGAGGDPVGGPAEESQTLSQNTQGCWSAPAVSDSGLYTCSSLERSYSQVLARYQLHVLSSSTLQPERAK